MQMRAIHAQNTNGSAGKPTTPQRKLMSALTLMESLSESRLRRRHSNALF
jgi:hypothetical protein